MALGVRHHLLGKRGLFLKSDSSSYLRSNTCTPVGSQPSVEGRCANTAFFALLDHLPARRLTWPTSSHKSDLQFFYFLSLNRFPAARLLVRASTLPLLPSTADRRGARGDGRDHYITKHPRAIVLGNCHAGLPRRCLQASGQVLCATLQTQGSGRVGGSKGRGGGIM